LKNNIEINKTAKNKIATFKKTLEGRYLRGAESPTTG